jgi:acetyl-CoA C-acetyltransferase
MKLQDFDLVEIHEAFASTVLTTEAGLAGRGVLSATGSASTRRSAPSTRTGSTSPARPWRPVHPFAATGGRIVATLAKLLHEKGSGSRGLISICAAGGQGVVAVLEAA